MTFNDYIQNPMGKKNAVFSQREMFRTMYANKLDVIMVREKGKIEYIQFVDKKKDKYYIYFKIPSEVIKDFYYDVVVEFYAHDPVLKGVNNLKGYSVRFFSNDPAFVFTFAHAFITNDAFIKELTPKMSKQAVQKVATEKNPKDEMGYVKSIFFAFLYMNQKGLFNKITFLDAKQIDFKNLMKSIMHADQKIALRQEAQDDYDRKLRQTKKLSQNKKVENKELASQVTNKYDVSVVKSVPLAKRVAKAKSSSAIKTTKTTRRK